MSLGLFMLLYYATSDLYTMKK